MKAMAHAHHGRHNFAAHAANTQIAQQKFRITKALAAHSSGAPGLLSSTCNTHGAQPVLL